MARMKLTPDDIVVITTIVNTAIDTRVPKVVHDTVQPMLDGLEARVIQRIDDLDDALSLQMEHGLQEVRDQISVLADTVGRIEMQQRAMVAQLDDHSVRLGRLEKYTGLSSA